MRLLHRLTSIAILIGGVSLILGGFAGGVQAIFDGRIDLNVKFMTNLLAGGVSLWCAFAAFKGSAEHSRLIVALLLAISALYASLLALKFWGGALFSYDKEYVVVVVAALVCALLYAVTSPQASEA